MSRVYFCARAHTFSGLNKTRKQKQNAAKETNIGKIADYHIHSRMKFQRIEWHGFPVYNLKKEN